MFKQKSLILSILSPLQPMYQFVRRMIRGVMRSLLRRWILINRRDRYGRAGFVLPTVTMVLLVVVLLSLAITFRAFDRADDARLTRVSEQTLNAAAPAVARAQAKIAEVMRELDQDSSRDLSDVEIYKALTTEKYIFGSGDNREKVLNVSFDLDGNGSIQANGNESGSDGSLSVDDDFKDNELIQTAWKYRMDKDNDGKDDSYTIYGIFFRNPDLGDPRTPLDARTLPMPPLGGDDEDCAFVSRASDNLLTAEGWAPVRGKLKKSMFVYTVTVPKEKEDGTTDPASASSPLEYQQDWQQKPLRGVVYRDDLEIAPGPAFNINGSLKTTSNLIVSHFGNGLKIYQVTGKGSCFYDADLSKIEVGGNVLNGMVGNNTNQNSVEVHLFQGEGDAAPNPKTVDISTTNQSTTDSVFQAMYFDQPYRERLESLIAAQLGDDNKDDFSNDPESVQSIVIRRTEEDETLTVEKARREELKKYFAERLRKIPYSDDGDTEGAATVAPGSDSNELEPPPDWSDVDAAGVSLTDTQLEATEPETQRINGVEDFLGDRVLVGNNLPAFEWDENNQSWVFATQPLGTWSDQENQDTNRTRVTQAEELPVAGDLSRDGFWEKTAAKKPSSAFDGIGGLRVITGAGVYERRNSFLPPPTWQGQLVYDDPATTDVETLPIVWPDTMPMSPLTKGEVYDNSGLYNDNGTPVDPNFNFADNWGNYTAGTAAITPTIDPNTDQYDKGDLRMRATAVYHYAQDVIDFPTDTDQTPIACVSSYYDPTDSLTAKNLEALPWNNEAGGRSNNGIVYGPPGIARPASASLDATTGLFTISGAGSELASQANYVFPDGRFANEPLRDALQTLADGNELTIANQAAIDSTLCALDILGGSTPNDSLIPHGAIQEVTLLNAREVKAIHQDNPETEVDETFTLSSPLTGNQQADLNGDNYDLPLEHRQPLEIRVTQLDLDQLRQQTINNTQATDLDLLNPEYLLPYSGVIYASRDDALPDRSYREEGDDGINKELSEALSPTDFELDPTRRPNGIMLVNGESLGRGEENYGSEPEVLREQGLTLVSNLPVYIKGTFNPHTQREFNGGFSWNFNQFYGRSRDNLNDNFACRPGDPIREAFGKDCSDGDNWRPATVLADAITLLSDNFRLGYRDEGDFDLRNNAGNVVVGYDFNGTTPGLGSGNENSFNMDLNGNGTTTDTAVPGEEITAKVARQLNGFNAYNDFAINGLSSGAEFDTDDDGTVAETYDDNNYRNNNNAVTGAADSSYFNNFVTPVQRRGNFSEYVMEVCLKLPVSACQPDDWVVLIDGNGNGEFDTGETIDKTSNVLANTTQNTTTLKANLLAGTTAQPPATDLKRFPRRVAFKRNTTATPPTDNLVLGSGLPIPLGIKGGKIIDATFANANKTPDTAQNGLWFQTRTGNTKNWGSNNSLWYYNPSDENNPAFGPGTTPTVQQPLLVPVLQIHATTNQPAAAVGNLPTGTNANEGTRWLPRPQNDTEFNLVLGAGDVPGRPEETNGGLQNLARVLENWETPQRATTIQGSFVQSGRSAYATAPYIALRQANEGQVFGEATPYINNNAGQRIGYFTPPERDWGFDVGLLSQPPDYFTRKFARLETEQTGESEENVGTKSYKVEQFFREVARDDRWVKALLCATDEDGEEVFDFGGRRNQECKDYGA